MTVRNIEVQSFPNFGTKERIVVVAVLSQDASGLYAVYVGLAPEASILDPNKVPEVAGHIECSGAKMSFAKSQQFFRGIAESEYRH